MDAVFTYATALDTELNTELNADVDAEFDLDVRVVEAGEPVGALLRSTDDNCGSTCSGTACVTNVANPS
jgi:FxLD family lantipeptide